MIKLIVPTAEMEQAALAFKKAFYDAGERVINGSCRLDNDRFTYTEWLEMLERNRGEATADPRFGTSDTYFAADGAGGLVGIVNIRYTLTPFYKDSGHIGCSILPGLRGRGFGAELLKEALAEAKAHGLNEVKAVCRDDNFASKKMMLKCGAVLSRVFESNGRYKEEYVIPLSPFKKTAVTKKLDIIGESYPGEYKTSRTACRAIAVRGGKLLLSYEAKEDQWMLPGGGIEEGETDLECVVRETAEETGLVIKPTECLVEISEYYDEHRFVNRYFLAETVGRTEQKLTAQESASGLEPRWEPLDEMLDYFSRYEAFSESGGTERGRYLREHTALSLILKRQSGHNFEAEKLSNRYAVRRLGANDVKTVLRLCEGNPTFYKHCPPFVTEESISDDMRALPPNMTEKDKHYIGFFEGEKLVAVMDLITGYPFESCAFIGFFMTDASVQGRGEGSAIISGACEYLASIGFNFIRLGYVKTNPQASGFWHKNGFIETGASYDTDDYTVTVAQRVL